MGAGDFVRGVVLRLLWEGETAVVEFFTADATCEGGLVLVEAFACAGLVYSVGLGEFLGVFEELPFWG